MITRTDAIVLNRMNYGETSQIVTLFTRTQGKISVLAKGARLPKSKFGSSLQPLSYTQVVYYYKPTRTLQTLNESTHLEVFQETLRDIKKLEIGMQMVELTHTTLEEEAKQPIIFRHLIQCLQYLNITSNNLDNILFYFNLKMALYLGFEPNIEKEAILALTPEGGYLNLETGEVMPTHHKKRATTLRASRPTLRAFSICACAPFETIMRMKLSETVQQELNTLIYSYLQFHIEDLKVTKSAKIFKQMK